MSEQQTTTTGKDASEQGLDRRKFLLRTTAITAGAWAAPSILTIDKAFGADGSPEPPCCPKTSDAATAKGLVVVGLTDTAIPIRANACLNDDDLGVGPVTLPGGLGTIEAADAQCTCGAKVSTADVQLTVGGQPITAQALQSSASCGCDGKDTGGSTVYNVQVGQLGPFNGSTFQEIAIPNLVPGVVGVVRLNEGPSTGADPGEYNAVRIIFNDPLGDSIDLKLASSKVECA